MKETETGVDNHFRRNFWRFSDVRLGRSSIEKWKISSFASVEISLQR